MYFKLPLAALLLILFINSPGVYAQAPDLGTARDFVLFTTTGAVSNTGVSHLTGNIGAQTGAVSGFGNVDGVMHSGDAATAQASADLLVAYNQLNAVPSTAAHAPVLGGGETLFAGVYNITGAGSTVTDLTLDALGDPDALFIFRIGGAFSAGPASHVILINGAVACNVFWQVEGAAAMAALSYMRGTFIANNGAMSMAAGSKLEGRLLSTTGAIAVDGTVACMPLGCGVPILTGPPAPDMASTLSYALFTSKGAVTNSGISTVTGDIGSNLGTVSGFNPALVTGTIHPVPDASTAQCDLDLHRVNHYLDSLPYDIELLYPAQLGASLVLTPHIYRLNGPTLFTDTLFLNAQGNSSAVFVIQVNGDFLTAIQSTVQLQNGACADHVFWKMDQGTSINNGSSFTGNLICNDPVGLNSGVTLNGRALSDSGDINTDAVTVGMPADCGTVLPVELVSFSGICDQQQFQLQWLTASEIHNDHFSVQRSANGKSWLEVGRVPGAGNSPVPTHYRFTDAQPLPGSSYYRLQQSDEEEGVSYSSVIQLKNCDEEPGMLAISPNPSHGLFHLYYTGLAGQVTSVVVYNLLGLPVYQSSSLPSTINLNGSPEGVYFVQLNTLSRTFIQKLILN